jgi:hypothetical protein
MLRAEGESNDAPPGLAAAQRDRECDNLRDTALPGLALAATVSGRGETRS